MSDRMMEHRSEAQLATLAAAIAGFESLTTAEKALVCNEPKPDPANVQACRLLMAHGIDVLGESFLAIRSPQLRRDAGAIYTPDVVVRAMIAWADREGSPYRVVDPGCGSGRFTAAAAIAFPEAKLVACDIDPLAVLLLRARATAQGFSDRLNVSLVDYRELSLPPVNGSTLFIGNPPFVRHHKLSKEAKEWFTRTAKRFGYNASRLAGLHAYFFLRTRELARKGDYGAFITSAEWLDVNYGSVIREMLGDGLGGASLHLIAANGKPFGETMTTGAITCFQVGRRPDSLTINLISSVAELDDLSSGDAIDWSKVSAQNRWSKLARGESVQPAGYVRLGELFRVHRGTVTGSNSTFLEGSYSGALPSRFLIPVVTRARELFEAGQSLDSVAQLRRAIALPSELNDLSEREAFQIRKYLKWAAGKGASITYTGKSRQAWWAVPLREPAPILCTYMARRPPAFVRNHANAAHINIAHGLYPRVGMSDAELSGYASWLTANVSQKDGRTYAGGLTKFEPKEIESILVPCLEQMRELCQTSSVDVRAARTRRQDCTRSVPIRAVAGAA
jgi:SAM-dependent methyltransferase